MNPLSALFTATVLARNSLYDRGILKMHRLQWPVVSIGNISVGGSGKTPFTTLLGELLQAKGMAFDILSRGYKRQGKDIRLVEENGSPDEFGDEPLLMAKKLHVPVIVGADRVAAGQFSERMFRDLRPAHGSSWMHLLDDGFQHRRLARDFDIVLVNKEDLANQPLPVGRLREPLSSLRRADAIVLPEEFLAKELPLECKLVWRVRRTLDFAKDELPSRPIVICGIARPYRFGKDLKAHGVQPVAEAFFPDHHSYTDNDVRNLLNLREQHQADGFVTTEKDAINLAPHLAALSPVSVVPLKMELLESARSLEAMLSVVAERLRVRTQD